MRPPASTDSVMFSGLVSRTSLRSFGSCTGIAVVITGMVIRKMISSTSITSTSGVVLMAETTSSSSPLAGPTLIAMAGLLGLYRGLRRAEQNGVQVRPESANALHRCLVAAHQPVVSKHRRHRHRQTDRRHDQRFTHRSRDLVDRRLARDADRCQRMIDTPHRAEKSHERCRRTDGGEK